MVPTITETLIYSRIRQLEDALAILQSTVSHECHPLLSNDLLSLKQGALTATSSSSGLKTTLDSLGTLTIGERGEAKYFGVSAGTEVSTQTPEMIAPCLIKSHRHSILCVLILF